MEDLRTQKAKILYEELCTEEPSISMTFSESGEGVGVEAVTVFTMSYLLTIFIILPQVSSWNAVVRL